MDAGPSNGGGAGKGRNGGVPRGPSPSRIEPFVPKTDHNPRDLESWAKRTGFNPNLSGETAASGAAPARPPPQPPSVPVDAARPDGRLRRSRSPPELEIEPILGRRNGRGEINAGNLGLEGARRAGRNEVGDEHVLRPKNDVLNGGQVVETEVGGGVDAMNDLEEGELEVDFEYAERPSGGRPAGLKCGLTENPGYGRLVFYGLQQYLSLAGSLVFIPLVMVPAMGGTDKDTATVISTMLLVTGVTTILHTFFGTRLPLVQGSSFVYLAPAMVIINSEEFRNLSENKFKHIMRELQGAIIIGSVFQITMGYSGLISLLLRFINPVVVAPTIAAVGLAFFSYGFPQAGTCVGISIPMILLVLIFTLYLRKVSIFGHRIFLVYAVPLSVAIVWAYAFFLTAGGAYSYKSCNSNIPSSNILLATCRKHAETMKHCRTDASSAWRTAAWVRVPYPFQWGSPIFHFKTSIVMIITSLVASVESVGVYHASSLLISLSPPTPGVVSRGIGLEGCSSLLAGLWGTGTGSSTLTENLNAIDVTKMASRKALQLGAVFLIFFSFVGKVGALLASVPLALAAAVLCFTWALIVALGLSTLQYSQSASSRNIIIIGFTLFISLSIPAYFQQYQPNSSLILPSYLLPYAAGSSGPVQTGIEGFDFTLNSLLSLNMVVALIVSFVLDNTVPGSRQERGVYIWSSSTNPDIDLEPYFLPQKIGGFFRWAKCVGV